MSPPRGKAEPGAALVNIDRRIDKANGPFIIQLMHVVLTCKMGRGENVKNISAAREESHQLGLLTTVSLCMHEELTERNNRASISSTLLRSLVVADQKLCAGDRRWRALHTQVTPFTPALLKLSCCVFIANLFGLFFLYCAV